MKIKTLFVAAVLSQVALLAPVFAAENTGENSSALKLRSEADKINYSVGFQVGGDFKRQGVTVNAEAMVQGILDALSAEQPPLLSQDEMKATLVALKKKIVMEQYEKRQAQLEVRRTHGKAFLSSNATKAGVQVLPSGLQYKILKAGSGRSPLAGDEVAVHYKGTLIDGTQFGSSADDKPARFRVDKVIPAWTEALQLMKEGAKWQLFVPPELGYGEKGPLADQTLVFTVELLEVGDQPS